MRGRIEQVKNEIIETEIQMQNAVVEATGDGPDGSNPMAMVSTIAESIMSDDIEDTMDLLLALQKMLLEDETSGLERGAPA